MNWQHWLYGLIATLINGLASGILLIIVDPATFNPADSGGWRKLLLASALFGIVGAANYLKKSPLPDWPDPPASGVPTVLLAIGLSAICLTGCGPTFMAKAAQVDKVAAHETLTIRLAVDQAHHDDCDLSQPGVQPCLNDSDYKKAREIFDQLGHAGLALGTAIRTGNQQDAKTQVGVVAKLANDLIDQQVVKLPANVQLIVTTSLTTLQIVLTGLN